MGDAIAAARSPDRFATPMTHERPNTFDTFPLTERPESLLDRALALASHAPSMHELLALTQDENADLSRVVDALAHQPGLAAAVLRAANSPAYGQVRAVADLHRAVLVIGMQELHDLVAGSAMLSAFSRPEPFSEQLQTSALLAAAIARQLATKLGRGSASVSYLSGLLAELGALACFALDPAYAELHARAFGDPVARFEAERRRYGTTTPALGARILEVSALPSAVAEAVGKTGLEPADEGSPLARVVAFARAAGTILPSALERDDPDALQTDLTDLSRQVGLDDGQPALLVRVCLEAAKATERALPEKLTVVHATPLEEPPVASPPVAKPLAPILAAFVALALAVTLWLLAR